MKNRQFSLFCMMVVLAGFSYGCYVLGTIMFDGIYAPSKVILLKQLFSALILGIVLTYVMPWIYKKLDKKANKQNGLS